MGYTLQKMFILDTSEQTGSAPKVKIQTHRATSRTAVMGTDCSSVSKLKAT